MNFLRKEWRTLLVALWLFVITIFLYGINSKLNALHRQDAKMASTIDSAESVVISTNAGIVEMAKKVDNINTNVDLIVKRLRRP